MKEKILKLIEKLEEREEYLNKQYEETFEESSQDYYLGKWFEVNMIRRDLQELLDDE